jgi:hypothetical protein
VTLKKKRYGDKLEQERKYFKTIWIIKFRNPTTGKRSLCKIEETLSMEGYLEKILDFIVG